MNSHAKASKRKTAKIKDEKQAAPQIGERDEEKDLTFHIKDRVELMRQVFSIMRDRELLAMAPECIRDLGIGGIQEILLDEVLGISSKRLHSILDGYPCPSDTESSDDSIDNQLETISLDSISSDDDILAQDPKSKKKHLKKKPSNKDLKKKSKGHTNNNKDDSKIKKHKRDKTKNSNKSNPEEENTSGMTVLELLELQARARAIRAQLAAVEIKNTSNDEEDKNNQSQETSDSDVDEVVIKEEPPDIVEIHSSSDDGERSKNNEKKKSKTTDVTNNKILSGAQNNTTTQPRKIKLNRTNLLVSIANSKPNESPKNNLNDQKEVDTPNNATSKDDESAASSKANETELLKKSSSPAKIVEKESNVIENKIADSKINKYTSDHHKQLSDDEIMLELSDSEKFDVLESLHSPEPVEEIKIREETPVVDDAHILLIDDLNESDDKIVEKNILSDNEDELSLTITNSELKDVDISSKKDSKEGGASDGECSNSSEDATVQNEDENKTDDSAAKRQYRKRKHSNSESVSKPADEASDAITEVDAPLEQNDDVKVELQNDNSIINSDVSQSKEIEDSIFEISDESDDETSNVLSKEPTREEIEELSRKIDCEIDRDNLNILEEHIKDSEIDKKKDEEISWKSRWLESSKVKKVLATSNLCNAMRKKNKELKKKLENKPSESIAEEKTVIAEPVMAEESNKDKSFEGSVSHYQTLPPSTKYVNPVETKISNEESMKADAKQLMKMYKKLLKINGANDGENKTVKLKKHKKDKKKDKKEKKKKKADKEKKTPEAEENVAEKTTESNINVAEKTTVIMESSS